MKNLLCVVAFLCVQNSISYAGAEHSESAATETDSKEDFITEEELRELLGGDDPYSYLNLPSSSSDATVGIRNRNHIAEVDRRIQHVISRKDDLVLLELQAELSLYVRYLHNLNNFFNSEDPRIKDAVGKMFAELNCLPKAARNKISHLLSQHLILSACMKQCEESITKYMYTGEYPCSKFSQMILDLRSEYKVRHFSEKFIRNTKKCQSYLKRIDEILHELPPVRSIDEISVPDTDDMPQAPRAKKARTADYVAP